MGVPDYVELSEALDRPLGSLLTHLTAEDMPAKHVPNLRVEEMWRVEVTFVLAEVAIYLSGEGLGVEEDVDQGRGVEDDQPASRIERTAVALSSEG